MKTDAFHLQHDWNGQFRSYFGVDLDLFVDNSDSSVGLDTANHIYESGHTEGFTKLDSSKQNRLQILNLIEHLRRERYSTSGVGEHLVRQAYYLLRPLLTRPIRQFIHRRIFASRARQNFPAWPVDCSVDQLFRTLMGFILAITAEAEVPFIWFWPEGKAAALMMTHDVEGTVGAAHCGALMDLDDSFGIPAAF